MAKPTLQELLKKHNTKNQDDESTKQQNAEEFSPRNVQENPTPSAYPSLSSKNIKSLFIELPQEKRFRLTGGQEINNLIELYEGILNMPEDVFNSHVRNGANDFARWVKETLGESGIATRLYSATSKDDFIFILAEEIKHLEDHSYKSKALINPNYSYIVNKRMQENKQEETATENYTDFFQKLYELVTGLSSRMEQMENHIENLSEKIDQVQEENRTSIKNLGEGMKKRYKDLQNELHELENLEKEVEWRRKHVNIMENNMPKDDTE